jgi:predicted permease
MKRGILMQKKDEIPLRVQGEIVSMSVFFLFPLIFGFFLSMPNEVRTNLGVGAIALLVMILVVSFLVRKLIKPKEEKAEESEQSCHGGSQ